MLESVFNLLQRSFTTCPDPRGASHSRGWLLTGLLLAGLFLICGEASASTASTPASSDAAKHVAANYGKIPLSFEPNKGQTEPSVQFLSRGSGYSLFLTPGEVVLNLERQQAASASQAPDNKPEAAPVDTLRMKLVGANPHAAVAGVDPQAGVVSYFVGNNPKKWHTGVPTYGKVSYARVYPGVDLVFYGNQRQLEYDFVVAPGADPSRIAWQIDGAKPTVDADGNLVLTAANGPAGFKRPVVYQMDGDRKIAVDGAFDVAGERISFRLGSYDRAKPLVIDPVLTYASYLGGSGFDAIYGLALDSEGSIYVTGLTHSSDFPVQGQYESFPTKADSRWSTAFVTKFSPDGSSLVYSTYLGGSDSDQGNSIALDSSNEAYVAGTTYSNDFPMANAYQTYCAPGPYNGNSNDITERNGCGSYNSAFITKLNSTGTALLYSTFFGGQGNTAGNAIAVDAAGRAYIAGNVTGGGCNYQSGTGILIPYTCFPTTAGAILTGVGMNGSGDTNAFVAVFDPTGADLLYSTALGDTLQSVGQQDPTCQDPHTNGDGLCYIGAPTYGSGITVDGSGNFYLVGNTDAMFLPTTAGVVQPTTGPASPTGWDYDRTDGGYAYRGYIAKFNPVTAAGGASQAYTTYLGGLTQTGVSDAVTSIVTDSQGYAYVTGTAESSDFPTTTGAYQTACQRDWGNPGAPCNSGFTAKLNPTGTILEWSTFLGGTPGTGAQAFANSIKLDGNGNVYVAGTVQNMGSMVWLNPVEDTSTGNGDSFVAELDPTGSNLLFATPLHIASEAGLAVDAAGNMYLGMSDNCGGDIVTPGAFQQTNKNQPTNCGNFSSSGYVAKISALGTATVALVPSPSPAFPGQTVTLTATVTPAATYASVPTGTIEFEDGSAKLKTVALNSSGVATYTSSTFSNATHSLTAIYSGDSTYPAGNGTASLTVARDAQTITFPAITGTQYAGTQLQLSASASSGLTVTLASTTPSVCSVSGTTASLLTSGTCVIHATQAGNTDYSAAPLISQNFTVTKAPQTISFPTITATQYADSTLPLSATASSGLPVSLATTTPAVCTLSGTTASLLVQGTCIIQATQTGNSAYAAAPMVQQNIAVHLAAQTITFPAPTATEYALTEVTLTATASSGLPITYSSISPSICTVSGSTASLLAPGICYIHAAQAGNTVYSVAPLVTQSFLVHDALQTITFPAITGTQYVLSSVPLSATASSGLTVAFASATTSVCTVSGATASLIATGTCVIHATQAGSSLYASAALVAQSFVVHVNAQAITWPAITATQYAASTLPLTATASSGLAVAFASTTPAVCTVAGTTASLLTSGTCILQATQAGNADYSAAPQVQQNVVVHLAAQTITFPTIASQVAGANVTLSATASSGLAVSFTSATTSVCTVTGTTATMVTAGTCVIHATQTGNTTYSAAPLVSQSFAVKAN